MHNDRLEEIGFKVLADLARAGLLQTMGGHPSAFISEPQLESGSHAGEDLFTQLRKMRRLMDTRQVAQLLCIHPETVRKVVKADGLPAHKIKRRWKYYPPEIAEWLQREQADRDEEECTAHHNAGISK